MLNAEQMVALVNAYVDGFAKGDLDAVVTLFAENAMVEDPVGSPPQRGIAAIRDFYARGIGSATLELQGQPRCAADHVAFAFVVNAEGESGTTVIEVIDTFRLDQHGKIVEVRAFWGPGNVGNA